MRVTLRVWEWTLGDSAPPLPPPRPLSPPAVPRPGRPKEFASVREYFTMLPGVELNLIKVKTIKKELLCLRRLWESLTWASCSIAAAGQVYYSEWELMWLWKSFLGLLLVLTSTLNTTPHLREAIRQTERGGRLLLDVRLLLLLLLVVALKPKFVRLLLYWTVAVVVPKLGVVVVAWKQKLLKMLRYICPNPLFNVFACINWGDFLCWKKQTIKADPWLEPPNSLWTSRGCKKGNERLMPGSRKLVSRVIVENLPQCKLGEQG